MPKCGLNEQQQSSSPWDLPKAELERAKTITDPVHGDIYVSNLELRFLDSAPMQRLRRVRQLGTTHLVYPGATHTRFAHSLGALRAAQDVVDAISDATHHSSQTETPTLFAEWATQLRPEQFHQKMAEAIVLARLGALLHDMCHVPFGHTIEDDLGLLVRHDENESRFESLWSELNDETRSLIPDRLLNELKPLILSHADHSTQDQLYPFVADIVGNTICADLIDYLRRDHYYTGLPAQFGRRFVDGFYVTSASHIYYPKRLVVRISRDGQVRTDVVSELFKFLRYRYELSERVLVHHAKVAADAMVGKMLDMWSDVTWLDIAKDRHKLKGYHPNIAEAKEKVEPENREDVDAEVRNRLEGLFTHFGDDGLLQYIAHQSKGASSRDGRRHAVAQLATDVLSRKLFKRVGTFDQRENASEIVNRFGKADERRRIEQGAAKFASLEHTWYVVLWIPSPDMKLKAAEVLVDDRGTIAKLSGRDHASDDRGREIYDAHKALWSISVYVHPSVARNAMQCKVIMAYVGEQLGLGGWRLGNDSLTLRELIIHQAVASLDRPYSNKLASIEAQYDQIAARDGTDTFEDLVGRVKHSLMPGEDYRERDLWNDNLSEGRQ